MLLTSSAAVKGCFRIGLRNNRIVLFCKNCRLRCPSPHVSYSSSASTSQDAYIALGSNLGDKVYNINTALERLREIGKLKSTSLLYESKPMYVIDQNAFLNAACLLETNLGPQELLVALKRIEKDLGRQTTFKNGPRVIDLDIVMLSEQVINEKGLEIPHPRIAERSFVLQPLCDIDPNLTHPLQNLTMKEMLQALPADELQDLHSVMPLGKDHNNNYKIRNVEERPIIMGILNVTPDSFSDGGRNFALENALKSSDEMLQDGADILDIGGESTRPGALEIKSEEEMKRVVPVIEAIKKRHPTCVVSIDTRKADVAEAALIAGADIVNDVSGGSFDPNMFQLVSSFQCPMIIMHSRGTPETMQALAEYEDEVAATVQLELQGILNTADSQIPRWLQIIDLGIGFAKTFEHNMALLSPEKARNVKASLGNRTMLAGPSRKRFLGKLMNETPEMKAGVSIEDKDWGTAGACCASILGGANIVRVHNVKGIKYACDVFHSCISGRYYDAN